MNESVSITHLILNASFVVQLVMLMLVAASVLSWVIIIQRGRLISATEQSMRQFEERFWSGIDLNDLYRECQQQPENSSAEKVFMAGLKEFGKMRQQSPGDPEAMMAGVQRAMRIAITRETEELENHLPMLATIGSTSPYVGLFGTVVGIIRAFKDIAAAGSGGFSVVAEGVSEALVDAVESVEIRE